MKRTTTGRSSDQRGFTLVELLAVMAIIGVLAAIVIPTVSGTRDAGQDAQAKQDISTIENAANEKFSNGQNLAQILSTETATTTAQINSVSATSTPQVTSSRWAERFLTATVATTSATYLNEFPTAGGLTDGTVVDVIVTDLDGNVITGSGLLGGYTAIDFDLLEREGYMTQVPSSATKVVTVDGFDYHTFLWLFRKETSAGGGSANDARKAVLFKLTNARIIEGTTTLELTYGQIL